MGYNHFVATILMKSVCVVTVYIVCMLMLLSFWSGTYRSATYVKHPNCKMYYQQLHLKYVTWQHIDYKLPEDDTIVSKRVVV
jgi:hypothetical protein